VLCSLNELSLLFNKKTRKMIKKIKLSVLAILVTVCSLNAQDLPQPSPYAEVMQTIGLTDVTVKYSRPGVKERTIFGGLEAYGEVWRTGANAATKIVLSTDANIGGTDVKAGTYSIFTIPGKTEWKVMINTDVKASEGSYKAENNVAEITVKSSKTGYLVESLAFWFGNVKEDQADLMFAWENTMWSIPVKVAVSEFAMENIKNKIGEIEKAYGVYNSSARYYLDHDQDLKQALAWSKKSVEISEKFWNVYTLSLIQEKLGMKKEALETAKRSLKLSEEAGYKPYIKRNTDNIAKWSK